ncbi:hypothetical protein KAR91_79250, partial [Candidatus Pacearchaeota archaeon]|nr:hypothetical protein [Candidatus Pacearchaeota archaeon]
MANPADVLQQLNDKLFTKQNAKRPGVEIDVEGGTLDEDQAAKRFIGHYVRRGQGEYRKGDRADEVIDVDTIQSGDVDDDYVTHRQGILPYDDYSSYQTHKLGFEQFMRTLVDMQEQGGPGIDTPEEVGTAAAGGDPTGGSVDTPEEVSQQAVGQQIPAEPLSGEPPAEMPPEAMDPGMGQPLPEEDTSKSPTDLGRIYELKKIYTRLTVIEAYLSESSDPSMIESRTIVSKAIELFEILASNLSSYKPPRAPEETLDEIIVQYYRFLEKVYNETARYYRKRAKEQTIKTPEEPVKPKIK